MHPREGDGAAQGRAGGFRDRRHQITITRAAPRSSCSARSLDGMAEGARRARRCRRHSSSSTADAPARNVIAAYAGTTPSSRASGSRWARTTITSAFAPRAPIDHDSLHLYAQAAYPIRERIALYNLENHVCGGRQQTSCSPATPAQQAHLDSLNAQIAAIHINLDSVRKANGGVRARFDQQRRRRRRLGLGDAAGDRRAIREGEAEDEALDAVRVARRRGEGAVGLGVRHRPSAGAARFDRRAAEHGHGRSRRGERSVRGRTELSAARGLARRLSTELGDLVETDEQDRRRRRSRSTISTMRNGHPENIYCRSDHFNYARYGIPIVFVTTGLHGDYHQVTDEPEYIDYPHMAKIGNFMYTPWEARGGHGSSAEGGSSGRRSEGEVPAVAVERWNGGTVERWNAADHPTERSSSQSLCSSSFVLVSLVVVLARFRAFSRVVIPKDSNWIRPNQLGTNQENNSRDARKPANAFWG